MKIALAVVLAGMLIATPLLAGCTSQAGNSPTGPVVAPLNTNPEPTESPNAQSPAEESESIHATTTP